MNYSKIIVTFSRVAIFTVVVIFLLLILSKFYGRPTKNYPGNRINIISATYGASCKVSFNNVKDELAKKCNGLSICEYTIDYQDPAPLCSKDYKVEWSCARSRFFDSVYSIKLDPAEAFGAELELNCPFQRNGRK